MSLTDFDTSNPFAQVTTDRRNMDYHSIARNIRVVILPVIILCGIFGNILFFIVLRRRGMNPDSPTCFLLRVLSIVDLLVIFTCVTPKFIGYMLNYDLEEVSDVSCKLTNFLTYTMSDLSCWVLVLVTIERFVAIAAPARSTRLFSLKIARLLVAIVVFTLLAINSIIPGMLRLQNKQCVPFSQFRYFWEGTFVWIDLILFAVTPLLTITIISIAVAIVLNTSMNKYRSRSDPSGAFLIPVIAMSSVTKMLVVIDVTFLVAASPLTFFNLLLPGWRQYPDARERTEAEFIFAICELLMFTNYMFKFYLCCFSGSRFRRELNNMFKNKCSVKDTAMVDSLPSSMDNGRNGLGQKPDGRDEDSRCENSDIAEEEV